jgi:hypothetical protein
LVVAIMALSLLAASGVALAVTKIGTNGPDTLSGTNGSDNLLGRGGNDTLFSRAGSDTLLGGPGKDRLVGGEKAGNGFRTQGGDKKMLGGEGNDLIGSGGTLHEPSGDKIFGGDGNDVINTLNRPAAKAVVFCGDGNDLVIIDRKDVAAADCENVFVGLGSIHEFEQSIPESFLEGQPPFFF